MTANQDINEDLKVVAQKILDSILDISIQAQEELAACSKKHEPAQISNNSFTNVNADKNLQRIHTDNLDGYKSLSHEPSIARVVVENENGKEETYYFCRKGNLSNLSLTLASLLAPLGRLASTPVGEEYEFSNGTFGTILENARFSPKKERQEWDAHKAEIRRKGYARTIESLRALLHQTDIGEKNTLEDLLNEESTAENITDGIRRSIIDKMDLRDQPILDQYQDKIFRLPLDSQLLILGAPGTGKTTTLIRRLSQKADLNFLDDDEKRLLDRTSAKDDHASSWIMFTPTELLKLYVKEAFSRENIPASDKRISTWSDFRENIARNEFPVLKSAANRGSLIMKDTAKTLTPEAEEDLIDLFEHFDQWQKLEFWNELQADAKSLLENAAPEVAEVGKQILSAITDNNGNMGADMLSALMVLEPMINEIASAKKEGTNKKFQEALNLQVNKNRAFLDEFAKFIAELSESDDDADDQDVEDEEELNAPRVGRRAAMVRYMSVSRSYARMRAQGKQVSKASTTGRIVEWLGDRIIAEDAAKEIGKSLIIQSALRRFMNPVRDYIDKIPTRYRRFRRAKQEERNWYRSEGFAQIDVHPLEVDIILLAMLRNTDNLISKMRNPDAEAEKTFKRLENLYYTQVLVDEATDFSPIQLACMAMLSRPRIRSFFACGDFNQRFTSCGVRSIEDVKWAIPKITENRIRIAYRHSNHLHQLAQAIIGLSSDGTADVNISEEYTQNKGFSPVLALHLNKEDVLAEWLASRIKEIEKSVHKLPSIAVLVNNEDDIRSVAEGLKDSLEDQNIKVVPCYNGRLGTDNGAAVRVFSVEHIKGLEFEAVFFVGIDKLAETAPDLFEKYLYVGATRAATYFGITCENNLPKQLSTLQNLFQKQWI